MAKLTLQAAPTFSAKVAIPVAGALKPADVVLTFRHMNRETLEKWLKDLDGKNKDEAFLEIVSGWDLDDEFNADSVKMLLSNYLGAFPAIVSKFTSELSGQREKN